jgi:hypothetical protein
VFPRLDDIVAGVPAFEQYPPAAGLEEPRDALATAHPRIETGLSGAAGGRRSARRMGA